MFGIGVDLGGTKVASAIFSDAGDIRAKRVARLEGRKGHEVGKLIIEEIEVLLSEAGKNGIQVKSVGVCIPGIFYAKTGHVWAPNIPGWDNYPLLQELTASFSSSNLRIRIDSDRACYILGETWLGNARGSQDAIYLAVGTGIGAGILTEGRILRGSNDIAGAIGWLALDRPFRESYISCGCFESQASGEGIAKIARTFIDADKQYQGILRNKPLPQLTSYDVFAAYEQNDPMAVRVLNNSIELWGMTVANLVSLFNPEVIILGGGVFGPAVKFIDRIFQEAIKWAQPISIRQLKLTSSALGEDAGLSGAGRLALSD